VPPFDDGAACAVTNRRDGTIQDFVDGRVLRKISDFRRAAEITERRQQIILNDLVARSAFGLNFCGEFCAMRRSSAFSNSCFE
jgi:hypothetical protein